jgi:glutathione S-transferase|tara:strand:+ start:770 stop:1387 length:618 start_codon:yes stop_codon:yes gene_type:complete
MSEYTLYYINGCPGARAVRLYMTYKNIEVNEILLDLSKGEHRTPEYLELNPMHTVPTLKVTTDNSSSGLFESRIILKYLDNNSDLNIDKWLYWDLGFLNPNVGKIIYPRIFRNEEPNMKDLPALIEKFEYLNTTLDDRDFLVGDTLSIADLSCSMLIENSQFCSDLVNVNNYPNIVSWINNIKNEIGEDKWNTIMNPFYLWRDKK